MNRMTFKTALVFLILTGSPRPQDSGASDMMTSVSLGMVKTEAEKTGVRLGLEYLPKVNRLEILEASKKGVLYVKPKAALEVGENDAFQNASIAAQGFYMAPAENNSTSGWIFPYSVGIEGSRSFESYAGIAEVGVTTPFRPIPWLAGDIVLGRQIKFGLFAQGGYKLKNADTTGLTNTGSENSSEEKKGDALARLKATAIADFSPNIGDFIGIRFSGTATVWYDAVNQVLYDREEALIRFTALFLQPILEGKHFDLSYERGSGTPNFNTGDQFSASFTMEF